MCTKNFVSHPEQMMPALRGWFFAVFGGINSGSQLGGMALLHNPKGIVSLSPALARFREGLRWVDTREGSNPERVAYQRLREEMQPYQGW